MQPTTEHRDRTFTILHTNDSHGRLRPFTVAPGNATAQTGDPGREPVEFSRRGRVGGFAHLATAVERIRRERGRDNILLVHGGDTFSDDLLANRTGGEAVVRLMNALDYQFMALGNHDFDYGVERTRALQGIARFPMRGANVIDERTGEPFLGDPTLVVTIGGVRVALLALGYHNTHLTSNPDNVRGLRFESGIEAARRWVPRLRERAEVVVIVSHEGTRVDREIARAVPGIDIIVGAHSHDRVAPPERVGSTWLAQALSDVAVLGELRVRVVDGRVTSVEGISHTLWTDEYPPDSAVAALVEQLREPHRDTLDAVLADASGRIGRQYRSESPFDRLVGDILRAETGADVALLPGIGYGVSLEPGAITREMLYTLLPHAVRLATLTLTGEQILAVLEQSATNQRPADPMDVVGGLVQTSGLRWTADLTRPTGNRVRDVSVAGLAIDRRGTYRVVTHSGMLTGLHRYDAIARGTGIVRRAELLTDLVENAMRRAATVSPPPIGDVTLVRENR